MVTIDKEVRGGIITLVGSPATQYNLVLPTLKNVGFPHYLDNQVIEECYFICDTNLADVEIVLPPISVFKGSWGPKFYISNMGTNSVNIIQGSINDLINGVNNWQINNQFDTNYFHVVNYNLWANFASFVPV